MHNNPLRGGSEKQDVVVEWSGQDPKRRRSSVHSHGSTRVCKLYTLHPSPSTLTVHSLAFCTRLAPYTHHNESLQAAKRTIGLGVVGVLVLAVAVLGGFFLGRDSVDTSKTATTPDEAATQQLGQSLR